MCGIAGIVRTDPGDAVEEAALLRMARSIRHRGPDGYGLLLDPGAGLVSTRLSIVDLEHGWQPLADDGGGSVLVYNGEVYNHPELREWMRGRGIEFETRSDTEVVHRLLEHEGLAGLDRLNGQFALAWWQPRKRRLTLVRDRFGVRPLSYASGAGGSIVFGSEAKALFASGEVRPAVDLAGLDQVFTLWAPQAPRTAFAGVSQLEPGGLLVWERGEIVERSRWWRAGPDQPAVGDGIEPTLRDSVALRLRADVPVGAYLSGGLDSSLISALAQVEKEGELRTFSVAFDDPAYDERAEQELVAKALGTSHHVVEAGAADIAAAFPDVVRHAETPLVRTAPVPLYLLARDVHEHDLKVVVTGEGADELFWGYDLFKEVAIRNRHRDDPERAMELLGELYPHLGSSGARRGPGWARFLFEAGAGDDPLASHLTRVDATASVRAFYRDDVAAELSVADALEPIRNGLPDGFGGWDPLERAGWLEVTTLLEPYLLAAQGDRVAMAHGVEGRYPFLDHRVYACSVGLPEEEKLTETSDKVALRRLAEELLPAEIVDRRKQPYRAPEVVPFFSADAPGWVEEMLSPAALEAVGIWDPRRVEGLLRRCRAGRATGVREGMALVGILSTQLWHDAFAGGGGDHPAETAAPAVRIDRTVDQSMSEVS
ncbi:MAG TPA: asparagine synthase (glutamine-hydrolyzing) [Solirubrobacterales bacterium]|nr:asparagine synthase (glutamine-hydrolyzing) [Solirubrobacterales bacterium]